MFFFYFAFLVWFSAYNNALLLYIAVACTVTSRYGFYADQYSLYDKSDSVRCRTRLSYLAYDYLCPFSLSTGSNYMYNREPPAARHCTASSARHCTASAARKCTAARHCNAASTARHCTVSAARHCTALIGSSIGTVPHRQLDRHCTALATRH